MLLNNDTPIKKKSKARGSWRRQLVQKNHWQGIAEQTTSSQVHVVLLGLDGTSNRPLFSWEAPTTR